MNIEIQKRILSILSKHDGLTTNQLVNMITDYPKGLVTANIYMLNRQKEIIIINKVWHLSL